ncbi:MAG: hypothetical protein VX642_16275 [Bdellovibrionota bacterium]|nr:hypothetical protein [Bdellovibrionota bacterium]
MRDLGSRIENEKSRILLLDIFKRNTAKEKYHYYKPSSLGLWAAFCDRLGIEEEAFKDLLIDIQACGFLNSSWTVKEEEFLRILSDSKKGFSDVTMIACKRNSLNLDQEAFSSNRLIEIDSFDQCYARLDGADWRSHLKKNLSKNRCAKLLKEFDLIESLYRTEIYDFSEFILNEALLQEYSSLYLKSLEKFQYPALHFSGSVVRDIANSELGSTFKMFVTKKLSGEICRFIICIVDKDSSYCCGPIVAIDYSKVPKAHNLYKHFYLTVFKYMEEEAIDLFDMGRGYVDSKRQVGCDKVIKLKTTLVANSELGDLYLDTIQKAIKPQLSGFEMSVGTQLSL